MHSSVHTPFHDPVLKDEVLKLLVPTSGERILDCTLGLGGHSEAFLEATGPEGHLTALDADETNLAAATDRLHHFAPQATLIHANFRDVALLGIEPVNVLFADLGLSSPHIDDPLRGFTFREDGPLDLRYDQSSGESASALIAGSLEDDLATIFFRYGEIRQSRMLANVVLERKPQTTAELRTCVEELFTYRAPSLLPQVFQALRIAVNDELTVLAALLEAAPSILRPGGRFGVIAYHSLEDRMVKKAFRSFCAPKRDPQTGATTKEAPFTLLTKKPIVPNEKEVERNSRSRSAKLRAIQRV